MDIKRKCNVNLSKFASSETIYNGVILFKVTSCITFFFFFFWEKNVMYNFNLNHIKQANILC